MFIFARFLWPIWALCLVFFGGGLAINCAYLIVRRPDKWDRANARLVFWTNLACVLIGLLAVAVGLFFSGLPALLGY